MVCCLPSGLHRRFLECVCSICQHTTCPQAPSSFPTTNFALIFFWFSCTACSPAMLRPYRVLSSLLIRGCAQANCRALALLDFLCDQRCLGTSVRILNSEKLAIMKYRYRICSNLDLDRYASPNSWRWLTVRRTITRSTLNWSRYYVGRARESEKIGIWMESLT